MKDIIIKQKMLENMSKYLLGKTYEEAKYIANTMRFQVCISSDSLTYDSKSKPYLCILTLQDGIVVNATFSKDSFSSTL